MHQIAGSLRYIADQTRPDIEFALGQVCRHMENYDETHIDAVNQILGYLTKFPNFGLSYKPSSQYKGRKKSKIILNCSVDSSLGNLDDRFLDISISVLNVAKFLLLTPKMSMVSIKCVLSSASL